MNLWRSLIVSESKDVTGPPLQPAVNKEPAFFLTTRLLFMFGVRAKAWEAIEDAERILADRQAASLCITSLGIVHDERVVVGLPNLASRLGDSSPLSTATLTCTR